jgi:UDP-N-acetyl-D-galactosamine dehydrogenase
VKNIKITIVGLGYVGLPLAIEFSKHFIVKGFDIDQQRINELISGHDHTNEISKEILQNASDIVFTTKIEDIRESNVFIITVPTPVDNFKKPDLTTLKNATNTVAEIIKKDDVIIYESTVYPGCTEEICVPLLEDKSGLIFNKDFFCGYSPERINPGDKVNTLSKIVKVTSGSDEKTAEFVDNLYLKIIKAGTHKTSSIKVAEASKAIENAQRDLNISFMNELSLIFDRINIDTNEVIEAAATKWNFLKFKPGLVGGHCISVDPYYLTYKAESLGYYPEVILSGRRVNEAIPNFVASKCIKLLISKDIRVKSSYALILGVTFKENCPDIRNSKVPVIYHDLISFGLNVDIYDPYADPKEVYAEFGINLLDKIDKNYELIVLAVSHENFISLDFKKLKKQNSIIFDLKSVLDKSIVDSRL